MKDDESRRPPNVTSLFEHPEFSPEQDRMELLGHLETAEDLASLDLEEEPTPEQLLFPKAICADCKYVQIPRSGLLRKKEPSDRWTCAASPREPAYHPQTGEMGYLPFGTRISTHVQPQPTERCVIVNPTGECRKYRPKISYSKS